MNKHTPGPWFFGIRGDSKPIEKPFDYIGPGFYDNPAIFAKDGTEIVGCDEYYIFNSQEDARLISAAPDLLEALKMMVRAFHTYAPKTEGAEYNCVIDARAAIAKATGEN